MNYKEIIKFNVECIELYKSFNEPDQHNWKIHELLNENIELYNQINLYKKSLNRKPIQHTPEKKEPVIWLNSERKNLYKLPFYKVSEITEKQMEAEIALWFNYNNN